MMDALEAVTRIVATHQLDSIRHRMPDRRYANGYRFEWRCLQCAWTFSGFEEPTSEQFAEHVARVLLTSGYLQDVMESTDGEGG